MNRPKRLTRAPGRQEYVIFPPDGSSDESADDDSDLDPDFDPTFATTSRLERFLQSRHNRDDLLEDSRENNEEVADGTEQHNGPADETEAAVPGPSSSKKKPKYKKVKPPPPLWIDVHPNGSIREPRPWNYSIPDPNEINTPIDYFRDFIDAELLDIIVEQSNLFSVQKNPYKPLNLSRSELEQFIGICFSMSIFGLPRTRMYWSALTRIDNIADTMSRNRWEEIKSNLHCNDNTHYNMNDPQRDRLFKILPLVDHLQAKFKAIPKEQYLYVDEQIVSFKGKSKLRQYNPKKPRKWGYKIFALCDTKGLIYDFEVYVCQIEPVPGFPDLGTSSNIVLRMAETIPRDKNYLSLFDNWFSCLKLFFELWKLGIGALSTVRTDRFPGMNFMGDIEMKALGRVTFEEKSYVTSYFPNYEPVDVEIRAIKWFDNRGVVVVSSFESCLPITNVKRIVRNLSKDVEVPCPRVIVTYNKFMGGVDLLDGLIAYYRTKIRSKKYYLKFIFHFLDLTVVNAWLLYRRDCRDNNFPKKHTLDLLDFKSNIAESLLRQGKDNERKRGRPSSDQTDAEFQQKKKRGSTKPIPEYNTRHDGVGHWPLITEDRQRCKKPYCKGITVVKCHKCNVHLCLTKNRNCFSSSFHA